MRVNKKLIDINTRRQLHLEANKKSEILKYDNMLLNMRKSVILQIKTADIEDLPRLERLKRNLNIKMKDLQGGYKKLWLKQINDLAKDEVQFQHEALELVVDTQFALPSPNQIKEAVHGTPLSVKGLNGGQLLDGFFEEGAKSDRLRVTRALTRGFAEGKTTPQIVSDVRDVLGVAQHTGSMLVRTGLSHSSNQARQALYNQNKSIIGKLRWESTLDSKTSAICQFLSGQEFDLDKGPRPPVHVGERSTMTPVFKEKFRFLQEGATKTARDANGKVIKVKAETTYYDFLKRQNKPLVDRVIGVERSALLRRGKLTSEEFRKLQFDKNLRPLTLEQMRELKPEAFDNANI
jgi:SPP1 gp7 family putative phage head morphogenesis protein